MQQNKVKVEIFNQTYTINGDAPPEYILQLADYVHKKMEEVCQNSNCNPSQAAILVALNLADEYFQLKKIKSSMDGVLEEKTESIISMLDEGLVGDIFTRANLS